MNRKERRKAKLHLPEERARDDMRTIFIRMGKFLLLVGDKTVMQDAMRDWYPYCRRINPKTSGVMEALQRMNEWEQIVIQQYNSAFEEDAPSVDVDDASLQELSDKLRAYFAPGGIFHGI